MYEELITALRQLQDWDAMDFDDEIAYAREIIGEAANAIEKLDIFNLMWEKAAKIAHEAEPKWIPVTEQLPIKGDRVLCFGDNGINTVDFVCGDKWCVLPWFYLDREQETGMVTHWMPLPEPPKEKEE